MRRGSPPLRNAPGATPTVFSVTVGGVWLPEGLVAFQRIPVTLGFGNL